jgi:hypothetical protein
MPEKSSDLVDDHGVAGAKNIRTWDVELDKYEAVVSIFIEGGSRI